MTQVHIFWREAPLLAYYHEGGSINLRRRALTSHRKQQPIKTNVYQYSYSMLCCPCTFMVRNHSQSLDKSKMARHSVTRVTRSQKTTTESQNAVR